MSKFWLTSIGDIIKAISKKINLNGDNKVNL